MRPANATTLRPGERHDRPLEGTGLPAEPASHPNLRPATR